jgi:hypothetical protein
LLSSKVNDDDDEEAVSVIEEYEDKEATIAVPADVAVDDDDDEEAATVIAEDEDKEATIAVPADVAVDDDDDEDAATVLDDEYLDSIAFLAISIKSNTFSITSRLFLQIGG